jgi:glycosyltransferase involved in cell wall biosynthesis
MVCAHEPTLDPRIRWEAEGGADRFNVTVLGFNRDDGSLPAAERHKGYEIRRIPRCEASVLDFCWHLKDAIHGAAWAVLLPLLAVLLLPILLLEIVYRVLRAISRVLRAAVAVVRRQSGWQGTGLVVGARRMLGKVLGRVVRAMGANRLKIMLAVLRGQFAPATSQFWRYVRGMPRKPDVVHCNDLDTLLVGVLAKKSYGSRIIYDAHEYYPHSDPDGGRMERLLFHALERLLVRKADAVVTVNHRLAEVMAAAYGLGQVHSVPNAEPWAGASARPASSQMSELAGGRTKFLFQGRFSPRRGLEEVIAAWTNVDPSCAALFLRGPDNVWRQELIAMAQRLGVLDRSVYFLESVAEDDLVAAAAEADVGLIPYKGEVDGYKYACPNKLSQYLHAGLMIVSNDLPYVREVIDESGAGLHYCAEDPASVVDAVMRAARDHELLGRCQANALRYARERFNWQAFSETLYGLYQGAGVEPSALRA